MSTHNSMLFQTSVDMPENGRVVKVVGFVIYDGEEHLGVREFVVEDVSANQWNAYPSELRPVSA